MKDFLSAYNPFGKILVTVEHSDNNGELILLGLELMQKKGELDITQTFTVRHYNKLYKFLKNSELSLVITDDKILSKEVAHTGTDAEIVAEAFPNLNLNDFYYQVLRTTEKSFIAVCRKRYIDTLIEEFQNEGFKVTSISLGALKMAVLSEYGNGERLKTHRGEVHYSNSEVVSIVTNQKNTEEQYSIEGLVFASTHSLPLAIALDAVMSNNKVSGNLGIKNQELYKHYVESRVFKNTLQGGIGFLLIVLLVNFFVFNSNYKKWQGLQEELQVYTTQKDQITKKQSEVKIMEALVQSVLTTGFSRSSNYINKIVQVQPSTIVLTSLAYQPLTKPIRKDKVIEFKDKIVSVSGKSIDKSDFTIWLRAIEGLSFVDAVTIVQYGLDKQNISDFELTLKIKSDETKN
ncbi:hypothetical protein HN014_03940 [Aquimarina sp. TRL1]|uniref:hypothetical protein n=1 Tax=Aquimarina sp. (strain TRL1) TaxID=2736252 RepID=UPI00158944E7|nr:hypothetical protein [Aquimarina sp. TRL1]QKX04093.1 hypothetical protein HN014_03940 [Aquimarina sp. TRL1]